MMERFFPRTMYLGASEVFYIATETDITRLTYYIAVMDSLTSCLSGAW